MNLPEAVAKMPQFVCHKTVHAFKIREVRISGCADPNSAFLFSDGETDVDRIELKVDRDFVVRHTPGIGKYFVAYADGYTSISPAAAFEAGYQPVGDHRDRVRAERADLEDKIGKLYGFINSTKLSEIPDDEQIRLSQQLRVMRQYRDILDDRIAAFDAQQPQNPPSLKPEAH